jgi:hypothetical protein
VKVYQYYLQSQEDEFIPHSVTRFIVDTASNELVWRDRQECGEMVIEEDDIDG